AGRRQCTSVHRGLHRPERQVEGQRLTVAGLPVALMWDQSIFKDVTPRALCFGGLQRWPGMALAAGHIVARQPAYAAQQGHGKSRPALLVELRTELWQPAVGNHQPVQTVVDVDKGSLRV